MQLLLREQDKMLSRTITKTLLVSSAAMFVASAANAQDWSTATETLYFDTDQALGAAGVNLDRIKNVLQQCNVSSMEIVGHTDSEGNAAYNQSLSLRRAERIKTAIVEAGFFADSVTTRGAGENELAVLTGDNVREQLNRRAEIKMSFGQPCGLYQPTLQYVEQPFVQPEPVYVQPEPVYVQPEPVIVQPAPQPQPVYTPQPAPTVTYTPAPAPTPAPVPVTAPAPLPAPVVTGGGLPTGVFGAAALVGLGAAAFIIADGDDNDVATSP